MCFKCKAMIVCALHRLLSFIVIAIGRGVLYSFLLS